MQGIDKSRVGRWDQVYYGDIVWDSAFSLSAPHEQQAFLQFCEDARKLEGHVLNATPDGGGEVRCFMAGFRDWLAAQGLAFPVPEPQFLSRLKEFTAAAASLPFRSRTAYGFVDGELRYASFDAVTNLEFSDPAARKDPEIAFWNAYVAGLNAKAGESGGLGRGLAHGGLGMAWSASEKAFVSNAVRGMVISGALAFLVLALSTCNLVVALFAMVGIAGIITSVVAVMVFAGWEFGVAESISVVILIGFSGRPCSLYSPSGLRGAPGQPLRGVVPRGPARQDARRLRGDGHQHCGGRGDHGGRGAGALRRAAADPQQVRHPHHLHHLLLAALLALLLRLARPPPRAPGPRGQSPFPLHLLLSPPQAPFLSQ